MKGRIGLRITSSVLFVFSLILFLSGCVLQRQSMHTLERYYDQIPLPDTHPLTLDKNRREPITRTSRSGGRNGHGGSKRPRYGDQQRLMSSTSTEYRSWDEVEHAQAEKRMAERFRTVGYVEMVETLDEVCAAVMAFGDLDRLGSRAARVLVYPESWDMQLDDSVTSTATTPRNTNGGQEQETAQESAKTSSWRRKRGKSQKRNSKSTKSQQQNVNMEIDPPPMTRKPSAAAHSNFYTARRLLFLAQKRYHAHLLPLPESAISPLAVFNMTDYKRLLYLSHPAQVLKNMDDLLLYTPPAPLAAPRRTSVSTFSGAISVSPNFLLVTPSTAEHKYLKRQLASSEGTSKQLSRITTILEDTYVSTGISIVLPRTPLEFHTSEFFQQRTADAWTADRVQSEGYYLLFDGRKLDTIDGKKTWVAVPQPWKTASLGDSVAPRCVAVVVDAADADAESAGSSSRWDCSARDAWRAAYAEYQQRRMEVCGLDLEV
ncbi:hypothetical protein TWF696_001046 [Orbilia brochopaga]|uniref:Uncharacterized protein n=1 Tax=Orbilia brochopaga TaxID=3140254 RepID=A0AAV9VDK5_9PEZI